MIQRYPSHFLASSHFAFVISRFSFRPPLYTLQRATPSELTSHTADTPGPPLLRLRDCEFEYMYKLPTSHIYRRLAPLLRYSAHLWPFDLHPRLF